MIEGMDIYVTTTSIVIIITILWVRMISKKIIRIEQKEIMKDLGRQMKKKWWKK